MMTKRSFMRPERISYKTVTIILLVVLAGMSIIQTLIAKNEFHEASIHAQRSSLSRVIEVAAAETIKNLRHDTYMTASTLQRRLVDTTSDTLLEPDKLRSALDDLFTRGFVGARSIDLVKLRVYDTTLQLVTETSQGDELGDAQAKFLIHHARRRRGVERFKALGGLWQAPAKPLYSLLVPIGGIQLAGYLEVVVDPLYNLSRLPDIIRLPMRISSTSRELFVSPQLADEQREELLPIDYPLNGSDNQLLYRLTAYENITSFSDELQKTQLRTAVIFITSTLLVLLVVVLLLNRILFRPVNKLIAAVQNSMEGNMETTIDVRGVREVHLIATAFNTMVRTIRNNMAELQRLSSLDALTGIANRRVFDTRLELEWSRALRVHSQPLALLLIDIDYFKLYNDALGHQAGDRTLREVAQLLQREIHRPTDLVARYGGEEFVVLLPETDRQGAVEVARRVKQALQTREILHPNSEIALYVTLSIGINVMTADVPMTAQALLAGADRALYQVKRKGRNGIGIAPLASAADDTQ